MFRQALILFTASLWSVVRSTFSRPCLGAKVCRKCGAASAWGVVAGVGDSQAAQNPLIVEIHAQQSQSGLAALCLGCQRPGEPTERWCRTPRELSCVLHVFAHCDFIGSARGTTPLAFAFVSRHPPLACPLSTDSPRASVECGGRGV